MKKLIPFLLALSLLLAACNTAPEATPTVSDAELSTQVALILTASPTATAGVVLVTPTQGEVLQPTPTQPAVAPTVTEGAPRPTATLMLPTNTVQPPTNTPEATPTTGPTPTPSNTPEPTATLMPGDPRSYLDAPLWNDEIADNSYWPTGDDPQGFTSAVVKDGYYELTGLKTVSGWRMATQEALGDFYLEMTFNTANCQTDDRYGIIFRVPVRTDPVQGYLYSVSCDGRYSLSLWNGKAPAGQQLTVLLSITPDKNILVGANQVNRLGIKAKGGTLMLYANGVEISDIYDATYLSGSFGVLVASRTSTTYTVKLDKASYWINPK